MVITKKLKVTGVMLLASSIFLSTILMAQTSDNSITEDTVELEIVDNNSIVECITSDQYDALSEEQKVDQELPLCNETEVTTEQLAEETNLQTPNSDQDTIASQCLPLEDYDDMTEDERATIEIPICNE